MSEIGGFEIVTPAGVQRRIKTLDTAWRSLLRSYPNSGLIKSEYKAYRDWSNEVTFLDKWFATGTLREIESWESRYKDAYNSAKKTNPSTESLAPLPQSVNITTEAKREFPWLTTSMVVSAAILLGAVILKKK